MDEALKPPWGLAVFFVVAYGLAYAIDLKAVPLMFSSREGLLLALLAARMWTPALGVFLALTVEGRLRSWKSIVGLGKPKLSWTVIASLAVIAAYTLSLPLTALLGGRVEACGILRDAAEDLGIPVYALVIGSALLGLLVGASVNGVVALGEEIGWRGYLLEALRSHLGLGGSAVLVGVAWGLWHAPLVMAGYNYALPPQLACPGQAAHGIPALLSFTLFTVSLGLLLAILKEASGSLYAPAAAHGTINAVAGLYAALASGPRLLAPPAGLAVSLAVGITALLASALTVKSRGELASGRRVGRG
jgi:membrane protease YdiL (CAAX protease family)